MKVTTFIFRYQKIGVRGLRLQGVQRSRAQSAARKGQKYDLSAGKRRKVYSWRFTVPPLLKQNQTMRYMALARVLAGDKKWEDYNRKERSTLMKAMGYPTKVPA